MPAKHILVPTDFGDASEHALAYALELAAKFDAKVTLLHVTALPPYFYSAYAQGLAWPTEQLEGHAKKELEAATKKAKEGYAKLESAFVVGEPSRAILEFAKQRGADLIVMATHGRRGLSRLLLGSIAEKIVRLSPIPVMTVSTEAERRAKEQLLAESSREGPRNAAPR
jgi:nucleotide-binding universal stress UspA family protein